MFQLNKLKVFSIVLLSSVFLSGSAANSPTIKDLLTTDIFKQIDTLKARELPSVDKYKIYSIIDTLDQKLKSIEDVERSDKK